ncbi:FliH/SctL family protein [Diaphorobacter sp. LR2014-1]|uniref:FliH/SctL family protein n=1 Tax=Diaphorobacter sp. LR2014-1 TaxID=1933219 RepID=UPI000CDA2F79|nr:FliH/SctL family protein [Diaphorobacter sp. LR2014-1]POR08127.1 flagellar assembly protein FliH [Diaphorobacter sp. LR2014-1]
MMTARRHYSRFIPREEVNDVTRWEFGDVDGADAGRAARLEPQAPPEPEVIAPEPGIPEAEHQALVRQAHDEGHARGFAEGQEQAHLQWQQRMDEYVAGQGREAAERLAGVAQAMEASLSGMQQTMAQDLLQLACDIARQVVRQELSVNQQAVLPVVREAVGMLAGESRPATVRLNPQDLAALEQPLREEFDSARIQWLADAAVAPGDCMVESAGMVVDGSLDKRWRRAIAALGLTQAWKEDESAD